MPRPGRLMQMPEGYSAFIPDPLPPEIDWTPRLVSALSDADRAIGRLAGEGRRLPNPHVLMRPFVAREAVLSSRIFPDILSAFRRGRSRGRLDRPIRHRQYCVC